MIEKRLFIVILLTGFLLGAYPVLSQTGTEKFNKAELLEAEARERERGGDYPAAMEVYQKALESETDSREREELQKILGGVIKRYYMDLYQRARRASSRPEMMEITILALSLGVEGGTEDGGNVFRKLVIHVNVRVHHLNGGVTLQSGVIGFEHDPHRSLS